MERIISFWFVGLLCVFFFFSELALAGFTLLLLFGWRSQLAVVQPSTDSVLLMTSQTFFISVVSFPGKEMK